MSGKATGKYRSEVWDYVATMPGAKWEELAAACTDKFGVHYGTEALRNAAKSHGVTVDVAPSGGPGKPFDLRAFLCRGQLLSEICRKSGWTAEEALANVEDAPEGLRLWTDRDEYQRTLYCWLPIPRKKIAVQPRAFDYYTDRASYYHKVQFREGPESEGLIIVPLGDLHRGHVAHLREKLLKYVRWIEETPNVYWFGGGDMLDNALADGRGMEYENDETPDASIEALAELLAPIAHKCLCMIPGNHEERTYRRTSIHILKDLCNQLDIPYFDAPVLVHLFYCGYDKTVHLRHGEGASSTEGGKINMAMRPLVFWDGVDFVFCGHIHDPLDKPITVLHVDRVNNCVGERTVGIGIWQSFLGYFGTYAHKRGYRPPGRSSNNLLMFPDGDAYIGRTR